MKDLLAALAEMPQRVRAFAEAFGGDPKRRPTAEEFSLLEHACHLRDIEQLAYTDRITRMLHEHEPRLADVDGGKLAAEADYNGTQQLEAALDAFAALRAHNVARLTRLGEGEWDRTGVLEGAGTITLAELARRMDQHDREHLAELARLT
jgi:hypothetical protein